MQQQGLTKTLWWLHSFYFGFILLGCFRYISPHSLTMLVANSSQGDVPESDVIDVMVSVKVDHDGEVVYHDG